MKVANYFLHKAEGRLTPIQVQKLAYFAQGWSLALLDAPLFYEDIEAWRYGPVIRILYDEFKHYGLDNIMINRKPKKNEFDHNQEKLLDRVWEVYDHLSGFQMSALTHKDGTPWDTVWNKQGLNYGWAVIPHELIKEYYKNQLEKKESTANDH